GPPRPIPVPWIEGMVRLMRSLAAVLLTCQGTIMPRQHGYQIEKASVREKLPARREPYWTSLEKAGLWAFERATPGYGPGWRAGRHPRWRWMSREPNTSARRSAPLITGCRTRRR